MGYGSKNPLNVLGTFSASTKVAEKEVKAEFGVIDGDGEALLGRETGLQLRVLKCCSPKKRLCQIIKRCLMVWSSYKTVSLSDCESQCTPGGSDSHVHSVQRS